MASSLSEMLGRGTGRRQRSDGTTGGQLTRAAGRGMREMVKEVVKEAIAESEAESRRSRGGSGRGMAMLGLGAIAGYLVRDWQLRPEMYEEIEEEFAEIPEEAMEAREESMADEDEGSTMSRLARGAALVLLAGLGFALVRRRRRSQRADQWTEERRETAGGLSEKMGEMGGDAGRMGEEGGGPGGEQSSETGGGSEGQEQESTTGGSSESSSSGSSESGEDEESSE